MLPIRKLSAMLAVAAALTAPPSPGRADTNSDVTVHGNGVSLSGSVVAPPPDGTKRPAVVLVHGAGPRTRDSFRPEAEAFARAGIVALTYEKRSLGYTLFHRDFDALAEDALAAVEVLRSRPDVDPNRVGLWGYSEGGWVAPIAAAKSTRVAFLIIAGASGLQPARVQLWSNKNYLDHAGVEASLLTPVGANFTRMTVGAGLFGEATHDPLPPLEHVRQPVLAMVFAHDQSTAPQESAAIFKAKVSNLTTCVVADSSHATGSSVDGFTTTTKYAPGYVDAMTSWVNGIPIPCTAQIPQQARQSEPLTPVSWYESLWAQLAIVLLLLAYPVGALVRRQPGPARAAGWVLTGAGLVSVLGTLTYLAILIPPGAQNPGPVILGRPLAWLALQLVAVTAVGALIVAIVRAVRARTYSGRFALLATAGVLFLPWAAYWGLFTV